MVNVREIYVNYKHAILNCLNAPLQLKWKTILNISEFIISQIQSNFYLVINYNRFGCLLIAIFDNIVLWFYHCYYFHKICYYYHVTYLLSFPLSYDQK